MMQVGEALRSLAAVIDEGNGADLFAEEFTRFRSWYLFDGEVVCTDEEGNESVNTIIDAISLSRAANISEESFTYDFSEVLESPIDEYILPLSAYELDEDDEDDDEDIDI
jgi:hypothetical protein